MLKVKGNTFIIIYVNPYKHSVLFVGQWQTVQTKIRRRRTRRLIRVSTIYLQNSILDLNKNENTTQHPYTWKWARPTDRGRTFNMDQMG